MTGIKLFLKFLKIGAFTFGGGYAMIAVLERELVEQGLMDKDEFIDMTAVAESTPGPIAVNIATYTGYKFMGVAGAVLATLAICIPSFCIIYAISLFFNQFKELLIVQKAFAGIRVGVIYLIFSAGLKMLGQMEKSVFNIIVFVGVMAAFVTLSLMEVSFSSIFYILICAGLGLIAYGVRTVGSRGER